MKVVANGPRDARLVALHYGVSPDGSALLITRGASLVGDDSVEVALKPQDWRIARGHRIGLLLRRADDSWYTPTATTGVPVDVRGPGRWRFQS